ncbi:MAG: hypothetical protein PHR35_19085 [Kiritimatiellae bacterium]|nr:hypothetical protein [Kiritimatiellia bacterium]
MNATQTPTVPALPPLPLATDAMWRWGHDYDTPPPATIGAILDALLKRPGALLRGVVDGGVNAPTARLWLLAAFGMALYGLVVGIFPGGRQVWVAPLKLAAGMLLAAVICWPSLYILVCLGGGKQSPWQVAGLLGCTLALMTTLMVGFAPVAWIFTQSTREAAFMGTLHLLMWVVGCLFALRRLGDGLRFLNGRGMPTLVLWGFVFVLVSLQMTTTLRPLLGPFTGWQLAPREFFLQHWFD